MEPNQAQAQYWTSSAGLKWIEHERALDTAMVGMLETMLDAASIAESDRVIDIGCGTGASTLAAASKAPLGKVLGIDISAALLARARQRADSAGVPNASFLLADAQTQRFSGGGFDVLISRIGMSFFSDSVAAFRNLAHALRSKGGMAFVCWAGVDRNPWFSIPKRAAEQRLGPQSEGDPHAPGPTAFRDRDRVANLMAEAGLADITAQAVEIELTPPGGAEGAARIASRVGPAARIMKAHQGDKSDAAAIEDAVRRAFAQFENGDDVRVPAVVNLFTCAT
ncbi:MAG: methyltransferase domain-containing protein [Paracoccaceae bacterium]